MVSGDGGRILRTLVDANVQFVVVGEPEGTGTLRLVVSGHPTNLEALGRALDRLGSSLRAGSPEAAPGLHRIGEALATVSVRAAGRDVDLVLGGPRRSLYAETLEHAEPRDIQGTTVRWAQELAPVEPSGRVSSRALSQRLHAIADGLTQLIARSDDEEPGSEG